MISFWPFRSGTARVQDVSADQLAEASIKSLQKTGRNHVSLRLLYRALEKDPYQPKALLIMSELYRSQKKGSRPSGDEIFSGIIIEYAMDGKSPIAADNKRLFDKARLDIMTQWGFVTSRGAETDVDHLGYMTYINELMSGIHSVANGFKIALTKLGVQVGALDLAKGHPTRAYQDWLHSDASTLHL